MTQPVHPDSVPTPADALVAWGRACLHAAGVGADDARCVAESLVQTSLWGIDSHGIDQTMPVCDDPLTSVDAIPEAGSPLSSSQKPIVSSKKKIGPP